MLVLKRKEGQWVEITHSASGDTLRVRVYDIAGEFPGRANLAFDDAARNFEIERPSASDALPRPWPRPRPEVRRDPRQRRRA